MMVNDKRLQQLQERAWLQEERIADAGERLHSVEGPKVISMHEEERDELASGGVGDVDIENCCEPM